MSRVLLMSDGVQHGASLLSIYDSDERFVAAVAYDGPETCIRQIRAAEANDPAGQRYPRTKLSDDASLILWDLARGLPARLA